MVTVVVFALASFAVGYLLGCTRSRDRLPLEVYDRAGRRIL